jgi:hypothetical protein
MAAHATPPLIPPDTAEKKRANPVHKRKRVRNLMPELRRQIPALFDITGGDYDRVAEDLGVPRADVLAVVLHDTRRKQPGTAPAAARPFVLQQRKGAA